MPDDIQRVVGILATGFTLFTLIVQGTTLRWVIAQLGLDRLFAPSTRRWSRQVVAVSLQTVREDVARTTENYELSHDTVRSEAKQFGERAGPRRSGRPRRARTSSTATASRWA